MQKITRIFQIIVVGFSFLYTISYLLWRGLLISPIYALSWQLQISEVFWAWSYLPLIPLLLLVLIGCKWRGLLFLSIPLALFLWEYGAQFMPNWQNSVILQAIYAQSASAESFKPTSDVPLRVMTWNSYRSYSVKDDLQQILIHEQPDIITIQEVSGGLRRSLEKDFKHVYPYQYHQSYGSLSTISRYPLSAPQYDRLLQMGCRCLPLALDWNGGTLTLINIHIPRPTVIYQIQNGIPRVTTFNPRSQELHYKVLFKLLEAIDGPILLQGDINTTERQPNFRRLTQTLQDSFAEAGWGMGFTYPHVERSGPAWLIPLVQIDHILHSKELTALSARTGTLSSSDHLYVAATLQWR